MTMHIGTYAQDTVVLQKVRKQVILGRVVGVPMVPCIIRTVRFAAVDFKQEIITGRVTGMLVMVRIIIRSVPHVGVSRRLQLILGHGNPLFPTIGKNAVVARRKIRQLM